MTLPPPLVLAFESSCDETACALVRGATVLVSEVASQIAIHARFGGVVPELASRHHLDAIVPVTQAAAQWLRDQGLSWRDLDAIAVTQGPGLIGALLVGVQAARAMAAALSKPLFGIHHLEGHLCSPLLIDHQVNTPPQPAELPPHLALVVSGGHTLLVDVAAIGSYRVLGQSRDDAVGEAYDKAAKALGLGYPGGPIIDRLAQDGRRDAWPFPRAWLGPGSLDFSFSGLKTALALHVQRHGPPADRQALLDVCASFQEAMIDVLYEKTRRALLESGHMRLHVVGGVAANSRLRARLHELQATMPVKVVAAPLRYCGDNAAMIAAAAAARWQSGLSPALHVHASDALDEDTDRR